MQIIYDALRRHVDCSSRARLLVCSVVFSGLAVALCARHLFACDATRRQVHRFARQPIDRSGGKLMRAAITFGCATPAAAATAAAYALQHFQPRRVAPAIKRDWRPEKLLVPAAHRQRFVFVVFCPNGVAKNSLASAGCCAASCELQLISLFCRAAPAGAGELQLAAAATKNSATTATAASAGSPTDWSFV